jgi:hypothetical protein
MKRFSTEPDKNWSWFSRSRGETEAAFLGKYEMVFCRTGVGSYVPNGKIRKCCCSYIFSRWENMKKLLD